MKKLFCTKNKITAYIVGLLLSTVVYASDAAEGEAVSIWNGDIFTSLFALALFITLLIVLGKFAWGPILSGLQKREDYIRQQIKDAETARSDAEKTLRRYETKMKKAEDRAADVINVARDEAVKITQRITNEAQAKAEEIINQAHKSITNAKEQAVRDLHSYSADLAVELAGKILGKEISYDDHRELIDQTLQGLEDSKG